MAIYAGSVRARDPRERGLRGPEGSGYFRAAGRERGFTILEISVVIGIALVISAMAIPSITTSIANTKLRGAAYDLSGLIQKCRIAAVQNNTTYAVVFGTINSAAGAFVDYNGNSSYTSGEPTVQFPRTVSQVAAPNGTGGTPTALDGVSGPLGFTAQTGNISFNARGLPSTGGGYVFYLNDTRPYGQSGWAAVSVTPAGRIKVWYWGGSAWNN